MRGEPHRYVPRPLVFVFLVGAAVLKQGMAGPHSLAQAYRLIYLLLSYQDQDGEGVVKDECKAVCWFRSTDCALEYL